MPDNLHITFEREDGSRYTAELEYHKPMRLVGGETVEACQLTCGDEIESHHSLETGGTGHIVVR